jgi:hypothetical protein
MNFIYTNRSKVAMALFITFATTQVTLPGTESANEPKQPTVATEQSLSASLQAFFANPLFSWTAGIAGIAVTLMAIHKKMTSLKFKKMPKKQRASYFTNWMKKKHLRAQRNAVKVSSNGEHLSVQLDSAIPKGDVMDRAQQAVQEDKAAKKEKKKKKVTFAPNV